MISAKNLHRINHGRADDDDIDLPLRCQPEDPRPDPPNRRLGGAAISTPVSAIDRSI
jgi:hypothetical protein